LEDSAIENRPQITRTEKERKGEESLPDAKNRGFIRRPQTTNTFGLGMQRKGQIEERRRGKKKVEDRAAKASRLSKPLRRTWKPSV